MQEYRTVYLCFNENDEEWDEITAYDFAKNEIRNNYDHIAVIQIPTKNKNKKANIVNIKFSSDR